METRHGEDITELAEKQVSQAPKPRSGTVERVFTPPAIPETKESQECSKEIQKAPYVAGANNHGEA